MVDAAAQPIRNWPVMAEEWARSTLRDPFQHLARRRARDCPCCGYRGYFVSGSWRTSPELRCPNCSSRPRDRFLAKIIETNGIELAGKRILHFAPEWPLFRRLQREPGYVGGDIRKRRNANAVVDITAIRSADESFDVLICNHVLEHVPDHLLAMRECFRALRPDGIAFFSVPVNATKAETWYPPEGMSEKEVERICGWDHKRLYGRDFKTLLEGVGFLVVAAEPHREWMEQNRLYQEQMFVCTKQPGRFTWSGPKWD